MNTFYSRFYVAVTLIVASLSLGLNAETVRVSIGSKGQEGDARSGGRNFGAISISRAGAEVAFGSLAGNFVAEDKEQSWDLFLYRACA